MAKKEKKEVFYGLMGDKVKAFVLPDGCDDIMSYAEDSDFNDVYTKKGAKTLLKNLTKVLNPKKTTKPDIDEAIRKLFKDYDEGEINEAIGGHYANEFGCD